MSLLVFFMHGQEDLVVTDDFTSQYIGKHLAFLEDTSNSLELEDIIESNQFVECTDLIPNLPLSKNTFWIRFTINNQSSTNQFKMLYEKIDLVELCLYDPSSIRSMEQCYYRDMKLGERPFPNVNYEFEVEIPYNQTRTFYIKMKSKWNVTFPVKFGLAKNVDLESMEKENFLSFYYGILIAMLFYNLFIYLTIKETNYLYYVGYLLFLLFFQLAYYNQGYKYLWPNAPELTANSIKLGAIGTGIFAILLTSSFLKLKERLPKFNKVLLGFGVLLLLCVGFCFTDEYNGYFNRVFNILMLILSLMVLGVSIRVVLMHFRPTIFFLGGWFVLIIFQIQFNLSNLEIIPYFKITNYSLVIGSIVEVVLISFALADYINTLKVSNSRAQTKTIDLLQEREQIITKQNILLEKSVNERTQELQAQNTIIKDQNERHKSLLKEIHHRVKNNLQIVISLLRIQSREFEDEAIIQKFEDAQQRVVSLALLHEKMYQSSDLEHINVKEHYEEFIYELIKSFGREDDIKTLFDIDEIQLDLKTLVPLGLIINEIVTNSVKYAFPKGEEGIIRMTLKPLGKHMYHLTIGDNGRGFDSDDFFEKNTTLGIELIKTFTEQLNGKVTISHLDGLYYNIVFEGDN